MFVLFVDDDDVFTLSCSVRLNLECEGPPKEEQEEEEGEEEGGRAEVTADCWLDSQIADWKLNCSSKNRINISNQM